MKTLVHLPRGFGFCPGHGSASDLGRLSLQKEHFSGDWRQGTSSVTAGQCLMGGGAGPRSGIDTELARFVIIDTVQACMLYVFVFMVHLNILLNLLGDIG